MSAYSLSALVIALVGLTGLLLHSTLLRTGRIRPGMFCFYTNLSNLLVVIYELALFFTALFHWNNIYRLVTNGTVALSIAACIWITHIIYHFVLLRDFRRSGGTLADTAEETAGNICVHYVTPLLVLLQWLLWADKTSLTVWSAVEWLILPLAYFAYAMLRAKSGRPIGNTQYVYPYPFLNYPELGPKKFWTGIVKLLLFYLALGLVLVGIGKLTLLLQ